MKIISLIGALECKSVFRFQIFSLFCDQLRKVFIHKQIMHGSFIAGLKEMIIQRFDESFWLEMIESAGLEKDFRPVFNQELDDQKAMKLIKSAIKKLNMDDRRFGEMFGNYWINYFAREKFFAFFDAFKNIRDFLNNLDILHHKITKGLNQPNPPKFEIVWEGPSSVKLKYNSSRGLIHIAVGLLKALGNYYKQEISVYRIEANQIKIFIKD